MGTRAKPSKMNIKELLKTRKGKGIAAGLILVLLLLVVLLITTVALPEFSGQSAQPVDYVAKRSSSKPVSKSQVASTTSSSTAVADTVSVKGDLSNYRDPFGPLSPGTGSDGNASTGSSGGSSVDVLSLQSVATENGVKTAIVLYKGKQYTVKTGDQIDSSPFQVTDIGDSNISLLYGSSRLTLQVGDTIVK